MKNNELRQSLVEELQAEVRTKHTYRIRAGELVDFINTLITGSDMSSDIFSYLIEKKPQACTQMASDSNALMKHLAAKIQLQLFAGGKGINAEGGGPSKQ